MTRAREEKNSYMKYHFARAPRNLAVMKIREDLFRVCERAANLSVERSYIVASYITIDSGGGGGGPSRAANHRGRFDSIYVRSAGSRAGSGHRWKRKPAIDNRGCLDGRRLVLRM